MKRTALAVAAVLAACNTAPPELLPPPFGPDGPQPTRLFTPSGLVEAPDGTLLVANANLNHAFDSGTVVSIRRSFVEQHLALRLDCDVPDPDPRCVTKDPPGDQFADAVMIGNYAGPLVLSADGTTAYTGSRDSGRLNAVTVGTGGVLHCAPGAGDDARRDCRQGIIDLRAAGVDGPFSIARGNTVLPGSTAPQPALFVSSLIPRLIGISNNLPVSDTSVAVLGRDPVQPVFSQLLFTLLAGQALLADQGSAVGPMVFDDVRRRLYLSGCFKRSSSFGAGELGTGFCFGDVTNFLRIIGVDSKDAVAVPVEIDLHADARSINTVQLLLADPDPATQAPRALWATMRSPDALVRIELPIVPSVAPRVSSVIPLPVQPADMVRIQRPGASELLAVVAQKTNSVVIVDTATEQVVAQVGRLGDSPFMISEITCAGGDTSSACLAVSVFQACRVALIEVPRSQPSGARLRALAGSCP